MEKFTPQKIDLAAINKGNRYGFEGIQPDAINRPIEASAYAQEIAESVKGLALNQPDSSQADIVGTPTVEISGTGETARFVFKSLKGERGLTGPSGVASGTVNSNAEGTSDTDGYTQQAVNKIASRPNLIINPDFSINQRGQMTYSGGKYGVDRWLFATGTTAEIQESGALKLKRTAAGNCCLQRIEDWKKLVGKTVTLSVKFSQITTGSVKCNLYTGTTFIGTTVSTSGSVSTVTVTIPTNATKVECFIYANSACEVVLEYAKLEVGSVATAFVPPVYESEIWKCNATYGEPAPLSNPNLLINPDFSINQRGNEFYVAEDSNFYTVDRIYIHKDALPVLAQKNGGGMSLSGTSAQAQQFIVSYFVEEFKKYAGKTLTLSIKFKNVTGTGLRVRTSSTGTGDYSASITTDMLYTKTFTVAENPTELSIRLTTGVAGDFSFDVDWWKLEVGSVATAFIPPLMAEELPKCQRYYQRYNFANNMPLPLGIARNAQIVSINFNVPKLRTTPTFMTSGTVKLLNQNITGLTLSLNQYYDGVCRMFIETSGLSAGTGILITGDTDGYYAFNAEIY